METLDPALPRTPVWDQGLYVAQLVETGLACRKLWLPLLTPQKLHAHNPSTQEVEAGGTKGQECPQLSVKSKATLGFV